MKTIRTLICTFALLCLGTSAFAQFENYGMDDGLGLYYDEEVKAPVHKEYKNKFDVQYSPSRYYFKGASPELSFNEVSVSYHRLFQVLEDKPFFAEIGAEMKYSHTNGDQAHQNATYDMLGFKVPVSVFYKFYVSEKNEFSIAPYAGAHFRATAWGKETLNGQSKGFINKDNNNATKAYWKPCQLGWHVGLRLGLGRYYVAASYGRDFPDKLTGSKASKVSAGKDEEIAVLHECGVHFGVCF